MIKLRESKYYSKLTGKSCVLDLGQIVGFGNSTLGLLKGRECVLYCVSVDAFLTQITVYREIFAVFCSFLFIPFALVVS